MHDEFYKEKLLLARIADGDEEAFSLFFRIIAPGMNMLVRKVVKQEEAVQEVLQEFFIKLWLHRDKLPEVEHIRAYLKRMALNECFTYLGKQSTQQKRHTDLQHAAMASSNETEATVSYRETQRIIALAVKALPAQRRQIYEMSRQDGLNASEIAEVLQLSSSYVRNTISAALGFIRERLKSAGKL